MTVTIDDIRKAAEAIAGAVVATPTLPARRLGGITGAEIVRQVREPAITASFKERGALNKLLTLTRAERKPRRDRGIGAATTRRVWPVTPAARRPRVIVMPRARPS